MMVQSRASFASARTLMICVVAALAIVFSGLTAAVSGAGVIPTDRGPVRGVDTSTEKEYLGIPYAAPPVGDLRWRPPRPHARWTTPLDATHFANHCPQVASPFGSASTTEDCLYLNVYTPNLGTGKGHAKGVPVMVWIHGGGLTVGESNDYDPTRLVQRGRVVVTLNYRLGYLGFLAHPALSAESPTHGSGDYGFMDQQAALRWVKRNIAKFGGDSGDVTIFGQSAGGLSVHAQMTSPLAAGLFQHAIVQSGAYALNLPSLSQAESSGTTAALNVGCQDQTTQCLRSTPVSTLLASQPTGGLPITPNVDGYVLPQSPGPAFESGQFNRVPVVEGSTHDEFTIFAALNVELQLGIKLGELPPVLYPIVVGLFTSTLGLQTPASAIVAEYPLSAYQNNIGIALSAIGTDSLFSCPGRRAARSLSQFVPTWAYEFNDPNAPQPFAPPVSFPYGAYHASELAYLFDSTTLPPFHAPFTPDQEKLAAAMVSYWTQFAANADPNSPSTPSWPAYTVANDTYQSLEPPTPKPVTGFAGDHHCAFWDAQ
jgi:para-nitrobenzyl esterase